MPMYEYTCDGCGARFEQLQRSMSNETRPKCPTCGSPKTTRTLSVFAVGAQSGKSTPSLPPTCGRCGGEPGSCAM